MYLYRHSGDTVSTEPFSDPWDSGQIGWIYADRASVAAQFGDMNDFTIPLVKQVLENEVATWNDYIMGENYAYDLVNEQTGEIIDGGFWTGDVESLKAFAFTFSFFVSSPFPRIFTPSLGFLMRPISFMASTDTSAPSSKRSSAETLMATISFVLRFLKPRFGRRRYKGI